MSIIDVWNLFKMTGKIEYFLKYKEMIEKGEVQIGSIESKRDNN